MIPLAKSGHYACVVQLNNVDNEFFRPWQCHLPTNSYKSLANYFSSLPSYMYTVLLTLLYVYKVHKIVILLFLLLFVPADMMILFIIETKGWKVMKVLCTLSFSSNWIYHLKASSVLYHRHTTDNSSSYFSAR